MSVRPRDISLLVDVCAGSRLGFIVPNPHPDPALENVGQLVLHLVRVRRDEASRLDRVLDDGEAATGLVTPHLEVHTQPSQVRRPTLTWANDEQPLLLNS